MKTSEEVNEILPALCKVKKELQAVAKGANNPFFKSKFADLNTYLDEVEPRLEKEGMMLLQPATATADFNVVASRIYHIKTGQYVESSMKLVGDNDMQKAGGGVTYARRYTLAALLSMQSVDDDGNIASGKTTKSAKTTTKSSTTATPKSSSTNGVRSGFRKPKTTESKPAAATTGGDDW